MEPLLSPSNLVGIENVPHLCQGREAPWLSAQASVYENLRDVKVLGMLDVRRYTQRENRAEIRWDSFGTLMSSACPLCLRLPKACHG